MQKNCVKWLSLIKDDLSRIRDSLRNCGISTNDHIGKIKAELHTFEERGTYPGMEENGRFISIPLRFDDFGCSVFSLLKASGMKKGEFILLAVHLEFDKPGQTPLLVTPEIAWNRAEERDRYI